MNIRCLRHPKSTKRTAGIFKSSTVIENQILRDGFKIKAIQGKTIDPKHDLSNSICGQCCQGKREENYRKHTERDH